MLSGFVNQHEGSATLWLIAGVAAGLLIASVYFSWKEYRDK